MSITCTREDAPKANLLHEYPKLMQSKTDPEKIVLFFSDGYGVIVHTPDKSPYMIGIKAHNWDMSCFQNYYGRVTWESKP